VRTDGIVNCWGAGKTGQSGEPHYGQSIVPAGTYTDASAGFYFTAALRNTGAATVWGSTSGALGSPPTGPFTLIAAGGYHVVALRPDGTIAAWGDNGFGQSEAPSGTFTRISASWKNSYAVQTPFCGADLDGSGAIDMGDVALILLDFGPCGRCAADLDASGTIDMGDVALALLDFGPC
jgi:hypothetical protein